MSDRLRFGLLVAAIAILLAAPVVLIAVRGDSGSAAFGDVEQVGRNRLSAATLDIEVGSRSVPISVADLAPGDLAVGQAEFRNAGTLPLRYALETSASTPEIASDLTWWFQFSDDGACPSEAGWRAGPADAIEIAGTEIAAGTAVSSLSGADRRAARDLAVDEREAVCIAVELHLDASNDAQDRTVRLDLVARAEQIPFDTDATVPEEDS